MNKMIALGRVAKRMEMNEEGTMVRFVVFLPNVSAFQILLEQLGIAEQFAKEGNFYHFFVPAAELA